MIQSKKILNEDELIQKRLKKCIYTSIGRALHFVRTLSPLSLEQLQEKSSINSSMIWRMEHPRNYSIITLAQAVFIYLDSMQCVFYIHHICLQIMKAMKSGKCLVILAVDSSKLRDYNHKQIILHQNSDDIEELSRRCKQRETILIKNKKFGKGKKKSKSGKKPVVKKKTKKWQ